MATTKPTRTIRVDDKREERDAKAVYIVCGESGDDTSMGMEKWQVAAFLDPDKAIELAAKLNEFLEDNKIHKEQAAIWLSEPDIFDIYEPDNEVIKNPDDRQMRAQFYCGIDYFIEAIALRE